MIEFANVLESSIFAINYYTNNNAYMYGQLIFLQVKD